MSLRNRVPGLSHQPIEFEDPNQFHSETQSIQVEDQPDQFHPSFTDLLLIFKITGLHKSRITKLEDKTFTYYNSSFNSRTNLISFIHHLQILNSLLVYHTSLLNLRTLINTTQRDSQFNSRTKMISLRDLMW